jgi:hypothetical protein
VSAAIRRDEGQARDNVFEAIAPGERRAMLGAAGAVAAAGLMHLLKAGPVLISFFFFPDAPSARALDRLSETTGTSRSSVLPESSGPLSPKGYRSNKRLQARDVIEPFGSNCIQEGQPFHTPLQKK